MAPTLKGWEVSVRNLEKMLKSYTVEIRKLVPHRLNWRLYGACVGALAPTLGAYALFPKEDSVALPLLGAVVVANCVPLVPLATGAAGYYLGRRLDELLGDHSLTGKWRAR